MFRFLPLLTACLFLSCPIYLHADERPNVLFIISDDQRPDSIHALGNQVIQTPNLDRLVHEGSTFTRAICTNPICVQSRAELLTGCSGFRTGTMVSYRQTLADRFKPWASVFADAGYRTCYVGKWHTRGRPSEFGYVESRGLYSGGGGKYWKGGKDYHGREVTGYRGWVFQTDDKKLMPQKGVGLTPTISEDFADAAITLINENPKEPFFLHVNFTAPHDPLLMPPGYEERYNPADIPLPKNFKPRHPFDHGNFDGRDEVLLPWPRTSKLVQEDLAVYYAVITHMDEQIGRILKALDESGEADNTIVIFTSDHGLAMGSHGLRGKQNMYEHTINIPMIMRGPTIPKGKQFNAQMYLRDIYPTTCDLADLPIPDNLDARSVAPILHGDVSSVHDQVFGYFRDKQRMVRTDRFKLIHYPHLDRDQLFDLESDPSELTDLSNSPDHTSPRATLTKMLNTWRASVNDPTLSPPSN